VARPAVVIALPPAESAPVAAELRTAGFEAVTLTRPDQLEALLVERRDIGVAILDGETDFDQSLEYYSCLRDGGRAIPALMVVSPRALDRLAGHTVGSAAEDEYFTRPYSAESIRWRVEAMLIRSQTVDDGSGPVLQGGPIEHDGWARRATVHRHQPGECPADQQRSIRPAGGRGHRDRARDHVARDRCRSNGLR
jgi:DNA-binding response OmpR family regulator